MTISYSGRFDVLPDTIETHSNDEVTCLARVVIGYVVADRGEFRAVLPDGAEIHRGTRAACVEAIGGTV